MKSSLKDSVGGSVVSVLFLKGRGDDPFMNKITSWLGKAIHNNEGFCHVEITVPGHQGVYTSSSIYQGETVTMTHSKTFSNPGYLVHSIVVNAHELDSLTKFIKSKHDAKVSFDKFGMMFASLPFQVWSPSDSKTFCSRYVTEALQAAGLECVQGVNASITTPSKLYNILKRGTSSRGVAGSVQHKQGLLKTEGKMPILGLKLGNQSQSGYERVNSS